MQGQYNLRSPAVKRLMREAHELREPTEQYFAQPLEDNLFEWHFTIRGPDDSDFSDGIYHGRIVLPPEYPMKPPSIILLTPNGRFEIHKKICLSISGHHPESWQPSWSIRTALLAIIGFMPTHGNGAIGSLDYTPDERKKLAKKSQEWQCPNCGNVRNCLLEVTEASKEISKEAKELGAQINMQGEKEKTNSESSPSDGQSSQTEAAASSPTDTTPTTTSAPQPTPANQNPFMAGFNPAMFGGRFPAPLGNMAMTPFAFPPMFPMPAPGQQGNAQNNQNMNRAPFWPPPFGMVPPGQMFPSGSMPGMNLPGQPCPGTKSDSTKKESESSTTASVTSSTPGTIQPAASASPSTGARPKTSSASAATSSTASATTTTRTAAPAPSVSSSAAPSSRPPAVPSTQAPGNTPSSTSTDLRQRATPSAPPRGNVQVVRERADLPRNAQSQGFSWSLCLLLVLGIILALLIIRRLIMMDIINFYDSVQ